MDNALGIGASIVLGKGLSESQSVPSKRRTIVKAYGRSWTNPLPKTIQMFDQVMSQIWTTTILELSWRYSQLRKNVIDSMLNPLRLSTVTTVPPSCAQPWQTPGQVAYDVSEDIMRYIDCD